MINSRWDVLMDTNIARWPRPTFQWWDSLTSCSLKWWAKKSRVYVFLPSTHNLSLVLKKCPLDSGWVILQDVRSVQLQGNRERLRNHSRRDMTNTCKMDPRSDRGKRHPGGKWWNVNGFCELDGSVVSVPIYWSCGAIINFMYQLDWVKDTQLAGKTLPGYVCDDVSGRD